MPPPISDAVRAQILLAVSRGQSYRAVAQRMGCSPSSVKRIAEPGTRKTLFGTCQIPTRLCQCGHANHVHSRGPCGLSGGRCDCQAFVEAFPPLPFEPLLLLRTRRDRGRVHVD